MAQVLLAVIYLAFIGLGLPDSLLGAAWPSMYEGLGTPLSYAGILSFLIAMGTVVSSLESHRLTRRFGAGVVTAVSVGLTALGLWGFSISHSFVWLCVWAIPYGLGAGSVDAALNHYVALHYASRHMSWLHCMWGVGTITGPLIMGQLLTAGGTWNGGYGTVVWMQVGLTVLLFLSLPMWKRTAESQTKQPTKSVFSLRQTVAISGAKQVMGAFFCYCGLEQTAILWSGSYLVLRCGISAETAATYAGMFFIGITVGRAVSGFLTLRFTDRQMIRAGFCVIAVGIAVLVLFPFEYGSLAGLVLTGLGCAPVYPCIIHSTPDYFGADQSQAVIGVQMASAYIGTCLMPPLFGILNGWFGVALFPMYLLVLLIGMAWMYRNLVRKTRCG